MKKKFKITMRVTGLFRGDTFFHERLLSFFKEWFGETEGRTALSPLVFVKTPTRSRQERYCIYYSDTYENSSQRFCIKDAIRYYEEEV
jgi:hypothetical protein